MLQLENRKSLAIEYNDTEGFENSLIHTFRQMHIVFKCYDSNIVVRERDDYNNPGMNNHP
jgi:hypothetical protein